MAGPLRDSDHIREYKSKNVKMDVVAGHAYALTLTMREKIQADFSTPTGLFRNSVRNIAPKLSKATTEWQLYPELTPDKGLLHYHGRIVVRDKIAWAKFYFWYNRTYGYLMCKEIVDGPGWLEYCTEEWEEMSELLSIVTAPDRENWKRVVGKPRKSVAKDLDYGILPSKSMDITELLEKKLTVEVDGVA